MLEDAILSVCPTNDVVTKRKAKPPAFVQDSDLIRLAFHDAERLALRNQTQSVNRQESFSTALSIRHLLTLKHCVMYYGKVMHVFNAELF